MANGHGCGMVAAEKNKQSLKLQFRRAPRKLQFSSRICAVRCDFLNWLINGISRSETVFADGLKTLSANCNHLL